MGNGLMPVLLDSKGSRVVYNPYFLNLTESNDLLSKLGAELPFESETYRFQGREIQSLRRSCAYGNAGLVYKYSGVTREANPWTESLASVRDLVQEKSGSTFNFVLCNFYPNGKAGLGWHTDDEPDMVPMSTIASVSLGAERRFLLRSGSEGPVVLDRILNHGSLLLMEGRTQLDYQHSVPKCSALGPRINLTFRMMI